jgi:hypothetical protein
LSDLSGVVGAEVPISNLVICKPSLNTCATN